MSEEPIPPGLPGAPPAAPDDDPLREDFRKFLYVIWRHLGLGEPTPLQYDIAWYLQHGPERSMVMGFRGVAKSWISVAYCLWLLYCDPQKKILVVSAAEPLAKDFTTFLLQLLRDVPILRHLAPRRDQRQSALSFDVGPARPAKDPSVTARGITGQITGTRAHQIIADDIEIPRNSATVAMRQLLKDRVREFDAIILPGGRISYLGTPQSHDSTYNSLPSKGYSIRIWPALVPNEKEAKSYGASLAPIISRMMKKVRAGQPTEPTRFTLQDLMARQLSWGLDGFRLQYMLDTSLSDEGRYPLKLRDLIVMSLDKQRGPEYVVYAAEARTEVQGLPILGMDRDRYYGPAMIAEARREYTSIAMIVDPSGRGKDETAYVVLAELNGFLYVLDVGGFQGGYSPETLGSIAAKAVEWNASDVRVEDNFGDGMFTQLLAPHVTRAWAGFNRDRPKHLHGGSRIEGFRVGQQQKELRIIANMGAALQSHRIVVSRDVILKDYAECEAREGDDRFTYSLFHQLSHLTRERGALAHDDRLDCLAAGVAFFTERLGVNPQEIAAQAEQEAFDRELDEMFETGAVHSAKGSSVSGQVLRSSGDGQQLH